ncbi:MAG TPA: hypothetical protein VLY63_32160, partial [Anaerolineae bacterium]|nr:hypothetical protein [Anaerolineae bacterium]
SGGSRAGPRVRLDTPRNLQGGGGAEMSIPVWLLIVTTWLSAYLPVAWESEHQYQIPNCDAGSADGSKPCNT